MSPDEWFEEINSFCFVLFYSAPERIINLIDFSTFCFCIFVEQVARASAFTFGVVYGSLKLKVLQVFFHRLLKKPPGICLCSLKIAPLNNIK